MRYSKQARKINFKVLQSYPGCDKSTPRELTASELFDIYKEEREGWLEQMFETLINNQPLYTNYSKLEKIS